MEIWARHTIWRYCGPKTIDIPSYVNWTLLQPAVFTAILYRWVELFNVHVCCWHTIYFWLFSNLNNNLFHATTEISRRLQLFPNVTQIQIDFVGLWSAGLSDLPVNVQSIDSNMHTEKNEPILVSIWFDFGWDQIETWFCVYFVPCRVLVFILPFVKRKSNSGSRNSSVHASRSFLFHWRSFPLAIETVRIQNECLEKNFLSFASVRCVSSAYKSSSLAHFRVRIPKFADSRPKWKKKFFEKCEIPVICLKMNPKLFAKS